LGSIFRDRETVLVFTQYTDTMDFLREQLRQVYGSKVACYSGRGGERWDGSTWAPTSKEKIKEDFADGEKIKILIGTGALSEGLNLQTCGVLINYDMPWNPMRVEQRIGRIDRIGQQHKVVWIRNYFYKDTIEARVYKRLEDRIDWFQTVVGDLQPILSKVARSIQTLAMTPAAERERLLEEEVRSIYRELDARETESLEIEEYLEKDLELPAGPPPPLSLYELESILLDSRLPGLTFESHPGIQAAHMMIWDGKRFPVTFHPAIYDAHPNSLRLMSFGDELLESIISSVSAPERTETEKGILRLSSDGPPLRVRYYVPHEDGFRVLDSFSELRAHLQSTDHFEWSAGARAAAQKDIRQCLSDMRSNDAAITRAQAQAERRALEEQARGLLLQAAAVEQALAQRELDDELELAAATSAEALLRLSRHGYPFAGLLRIVDTSDLEVSAADPFYAKIQGDTPESLKGRFADLRRRSADALQQLGPPPPQIYQVGSAEDIKIRADLLALPREMDGRQDTNSA
jgi:hypothetical protein